jgi:hypothetical protein
MPSNIPAARAALEDAHVNLKQALVLIDDALSKMTRTVTKGRAPVKSVKTTPAMLKEIAAYAKRYPRKSAQEIGNQFGVNQGRVTDALQKHGKRK